MWLKRNTYRNSNIESFPGCYNTGHAPAVYHAYLDLGHKTEEFYAVGLAGDITEPEGRSLAHFSYSQGKRKAKGETGTIHIYSTMVSARKKYTSLCQLATAQLSANTRKRNTLSQRAAGGDLNSILELGLDW